MIEKIEAEAIRGKIREYAKHHLYAVQELKGTVSGNPFCGNHAAIGKVRNSKYQGYVGHTSFCQS